MFLSAENYSTKKQSQEFTCANKKLKCQIFSDLCQKYFTPLAIIIKKIFLFQL